MRQKLAKQIRKDLKVNGVDITTPKGRQLYKEVKRNANPKLASAIVTHTLKEGLNNAKTTSNNKVKA